MYISELKIPEDITSMLIAGVVVLVVLWLVMFVVRKLVGIALMAALIIGSWIIWHDPALLQSVQEKAFDYYDQWRSDEPQGRSYQ